MKITTLTAENFRNLESVTLQPCEGVNILYGDNAQGKTNLLEAIWLFTGAKSFRPARDAELIRFGCKFADGLFRSAAGDVCTDSSRRKKTNFPQ